MKRLIQYRGEEKKLYASKQWLPDEWLDAQRALYSKYYYSRFIPLEEFEEAHYSSPCSTYGGYLRRFIMSAKDKKLEEKYRQIKEGFFYKPLTYAEWPAVYGYDNKQAHKRYRDYLNEFVFWAGHYKFQEQEYPGELDKAKAILASLDENGYPKK
jgi:hypothetical protein